MNIDLRQPTLVVAGHWNPRIFGVDWVAQNLFQLETGATVEVGQVFAPDRPTPVLIIDGVGVGCSPERLELYAAADSDEVLARVEGIAARALELLRHTPVFGFGTNFTFSDVEVDAAIADVLMTAERLEARYRVTGRSYQTSLALDDGVVLNLARNIGPDGVQIAMNFHHAAQSADAARAMIVGTLVQTKPRALQIMAEIYGQEDFGTTKFGAIPAGEENAEARN